MNETGISIIYPAHAGINPLYQFTIDTESSTPHTRG